MQTDVFKISHLFQVKSGDYHDTITLDVGQIPLVSCGDEEQGLVGYYDIPLEKTHRRCLTVAYNGLPLTTKYHPYRFAAKDDVAVLKPRKEMTESTLVYIAAILNRMRWRYHYGRKCFKAKLENVELRLPAKGSFVDNEFIDGHFHADLRAIFPKSSSIRSKTPLIDLWVETQLIKLFNLVRGHFHSISDLEEGDYRTVSRATTLNGTVGYFALPDKAKVFAHGTITVSTVGGDAFVQLDEYIATDNVVILIPKCPLRVTTLFFVAFMLNYQKWRYLYGRQCYKGKLVGLKIPLPYKDGHLDEDTITKWVESQKYWDIVSGSAKPE